MKAARLHAPFDLRVEDIDAPSSPPEGWAQLRVAAAGICGSDIHNFRTGQWLRERPTVAGHEFAGVVTAIGAGVEGIAVGDKVIADSRFWCGDCDRCRDGYRHLCERLGFVGEICDGGFGEMTTLPARLLYKVDPSVPDDIAAMAEPLAVALHAVKRLAAPSGLPVLVMGCGPIGGLAALILSRRGPVCVADRNEARAGLVASIAGSRAVPAEFGDRPPEYQGRRIRHVVDATGNVAALERLVRSIEPGATIAVVGITHGTFPLDPNLLVERELTLAGCHAFSHELPEAIGLLDERRAELEAFIGSRINLDELPSAYRALAEGTSPGLKTIVTMG